MFFFLFSHLAYGGFEEKNDIGLNSLYSYIKPDDSVELNILADSLQFIYGDKNSCEIYSDIATYLYNKSYSDKSITWFKKSLNCKQRLGIKDVVSDYIGISLVHLEDDKIDSSIYYNDKARDIHDELFENVINTNLENNTGRIMMFIGNYDKALEYFFTALSNANSENDTVNMIYINYNIGTLYQEIDKYEKALEAYLRGYELSKIKKFEKGMAFSYSIGIIYNVWGEYQKAIEFNKNAIPSCEKLGLTHDLAKIYSNMSNIYMLLKEYSNAEKTLRKSIKICKDNDFKRQLGIAYANMGKAKQLVGGYDSSVYYLKKAELIFRNLGTMSLLSIVYNMTSDTYERKGEIENAFYYYRKHHNINDSILNNDVEKQIAELQTKYETEKKEKENEALKNSVQIEKNKSKYLLVIALVLFLLGIISVVLFYFIRKTNITKRELAESEAKRLEWELESRKRELTFGALSLSRNIEFVNSLISELKKLTYHVDDEGMQPLHNIVNKLSSQQSDSSWREFEKRFTDVHTDFYNNILLKYPDLSPNELRLCAFLKLGMTTKEICSITFQSIRAVEAGRLRLRKKLRIDSGDNLSTFLQKI